MAAAFVSTRFGAPKVSAWSPLQLARPAAVAPPVVAPAPVPTVPPVVAPADRESTALRAELDAAIAALAGERAAHEQARADLERERAERAALDVQPVELARLREVADDLVAARRRGVEELREGLGSLVLHAARKLAGEALRVQPGLLEQLVEDTVALLGRQGLVLRVNPVDIEAVGRALAGVDAQIVGDPAVEAGCVASSPFGAVDASIGTAEAALRVVVDGWRTAGWSAEDTSPVAAGAR